MIQRNLTNTELRAADVKITLDGEVVAISASALPLPTGASTAAGITALLDELKLKADLTETQPVSVASLPLPSGAATAAKQLADNHNVKANIDQTTSGTTNKVTSQFIDESGTPYGIKHVQNKPRISAMPYLYDISEGNVPGHTMWTKIGYNPAITTSEEDLWGAGGSYVFPPSATIMEVLSSTATADEDVGTILFNATCDTGGTTTTMLDAGVDFTATAAIGDVIIIDKAGAVPEWGILSAVANGSVTFENGLSMGGSCVTARTYQILDVSASKGAMAVKVDYLDSTYAEKTEIIILNAATAVDSIGSMLRINSFRVIAVGTKATATNAAIGNLTIRADAAGATYSYILAGYTRARNSAYTVPLGKTLYVTSWNIGAATNNDTKVQTIRMYTRANIEPSTRFNTGKLFYGYTETLISNGQEEITFNLPTKLPAKTDLKVSAIGLTGFSGPATSVLRGWIE